MKQFQSSVFKHFFFLFTHLALERQLVSSYLWEFTDWGVINTRRPEEVLKYALHASSFVEGDICTYACRNILSVNTFLFSTCLSVRIKLFSSAVIWLRLSVVFAYECNSRFRKKKKTLIFVKDIYTVSYEVVNWYTFVEENVLKTNCV